MSLWLTLDFIYLLFLFLMHDLLEYMLWLTYFVNNSQRVESDGLVTGFHTTAVMVSYHICLIICNHIIDDYVYCNCHRWGSKT
jgi:hypothetical protein